LVSSDIAKVYKATQGDTLATSIGRAKVAGVYVWPSDGRSIDLSGTIILPTLSQGTFDQCWIKVWPSNVASVALLSTTTVVSASHSVDATITQLNDTNGVSFKGEQLFRERSTRLAGLAAFLFGSFFGAMGIRLRKLELASALHAGVSKRDQLMISLIEVLLWLLAASFVLLPILVWSSRIGEGIPTLTNVKFGLRILLLGALGVVVGTCLGVVQIREAQLFRYFQRRA
jgi:hypothetical protein